MAANTWRVLVIRTNFFVYFLIEKKTYKNIVNVKIVHKYIFDITRHTLSVSLSVHTVGLGKTHLKLNVLCKHESDLFAFEK